MSTKPDIALYGIASALAVGIMSLLMFAGTPQKASVADDNLFEREVVRYEIMPRSGEIAGDAEVKYEYKGERLPEKLAPDEDVSKRTETSYARLLAVEHEGTKEETRTYEGIFYAQPTFFEGEDGWHYIEHATTTKAAFDAFRRESPLVALFLRKAYAVDLYSGAGDGNAGAYSITSGAFGECGIGSGWNDAHASGGTSFTYTGASATAYSYRNFQQDVETDTCDSEGEILRGFMPIVTSSIPAGATITAATLNLYALSTTDQDNDGNDFITIVQTDHAGHTTLAATDYDNCGAVTNPTEGVDAGQRKDITSISTAAYTSFTLNSTGLGWIKKSGQASACSATNGVSCFGFREGHDVLDNSPLNASVTGVTFYMSEQTGTANDPYLSVTYTGGASFSFWQFQDF